MSRPTFARQFKKHSGRTFSEFLDRLKLEAACRELDQSERCILASGFTRESFCNRIFRRLMRCSPSPFRAKCRRNKRPQ